jgi:hypothetical protein
MTTLKQLTAGASLAFLAATGCGKLMSTQQTAPALPAAPAALTTEQIDRNAPTVTVTNAPFEIPKGMVLLKGMSYPVPKNLQGLSLNKIQSLKDDPKGFSHGDRGPGLIVKFSRKDDPSRLQREAAFPSEEGRDCVSWEGELAPLSGSISNNALGAENKEGNFPFSVSSSRKDVIEHLSKVQLERTPVMLGYLQNWFNDPCESRTPYFITEITEAKPKPPKTIVIHKTVMVDQDGKVVKAPTPRKPAAPVTP